MANSSKKIYELVDKAIQHTWSIPEFQRGYVWKTVQVRDLAESLWKNYPIGTLLLWDSKSDCEERFATDSKRPNLWVVDGQQRITALSILFGRKPYWWPDNKSWEKALKKYDIRFDIDAKGDGPYFWVANAGIRKAKNKRYIPVRDLLKLDTNKEADQKKLMKIAKEVKCDGLCDGMDDMEVYTRLDRIRKIRDMDIGIITVDHDLEDVVEIFLRMNAKGTKVTEADIYLGIVAARNPGWVRDDFLPYLEKLRDSGFDLNPNLLFRTLTGIGIKRAKFKDVNKNDAFWSSGIIDSWSKTQKAWGQLLLKFKEYGVLSNSVLPTQAALVTITSLIDKYSIKDFEIFMYWFVQASRFNRYSSSGTTSLEEDLRIIKDTNDAKECINKLLKRFDTKSLFEREDFLENKGDSKFGIFLLYLMVYKNNAKDWDEDGARIGFDGEEILEGHRPQWHHIFPVRYLKNHVDEDKINAIANIAVIGPNINIRISAKSPMSYIEKYKITEEKLNDQFIDKNIKKIDFSKFEKWLDDRAEKLAQEANKYLDDLKKKLK